MVCPNGQGEEGGLSQCGKFAVKGDQFLAILCGRLLWTTPNVKYSLTNFQF